MIIKTEKFFTWRKQLSKGSLIIFCLLFFSLNGECQTSFERIDGLTVVGAPATYSSNPLPRIKETKANWICLVPYGFGSKGSTQLRYNLDRQWWGEKEEGIVETVRLAREQNLKVLLKPQVYFHGSWPGDLDFNKKKEWVEWENAYREFIFFYIDIAERLDIEMFCIGTEFKKSEEKRASFWKELIADARKLYSGKITYSSNWDSYQNISFWEDLDYIGISAYFPLINESNPPVREIIKSWSPVVKKLKKYANKKDMQVLFTEYGYLSVDGTTYNNWELEKKIRSLNLNEKAQADALEALYKVFFREKFWAGGFLWKWFPNGQGHEGYIAKDYTPQNKEAEKVLKKYFAQ